MDIDGTLEITWVLFISLADIPSKELSTFLIVTNCPGIAPCAAGVVTSKTFDPASILAIGLAPKDKTLRTLALLDSLLEEVEFVAIIWGAFKASASALAFILLVFSISCLSASLPAFAI